MEMLSVELFDTAVQVVGQRLDLADESMLGSRLAWACAKVLPVSGVGICVLSDPHIKVPIGASDGLAAAAETVPVDRRRRAVSACPPHRDTGGRRTGGTCSAVADVR